MRNDGCGEEACGIREEIGEVRDKRRGVRAIEGVILNMLLWRKALLRSQKYKALLVVQWSRPLLLVLRFPCGEGLNPPGHGKSLSDA